MTPVLWNSFGTCCTIPNWGQEKNPICALLLNYYFPNHAPTSSDISDQIFAKAEQGHHVLWSHLKDELEIGVAEMALQVAPGQVQILYWAPSFHKMQRESFHFLSLFFLHHFTCRRRWATGSWSSSAGGSGRSLAPWKSWWWWWWWLQIVVMVTIMMKRLELCHRAAHLAHAGRHVRQGAVHVSGHWPAAGGKQKSRFGRILVRGGASMVFFCEEFFCERRFF